MLSILKKSSFKLLFFCVRGLDMTIYFDFLNSILYKCFEWAHVLYPCQAGQMNFGIPFFVYITECLVLLLCQSIHKRIWYQITPCGCSYIDLINYFWENGWQNDFIYEVNSNRHRHKRRSFSSTRWLMQQVLVSLVHG